MINRFVEYITVERRLSPLTVRNYRRDVEQFVTYVTRDGEREFDPNTITRNDLSEWIESLSRKPREDESTLHRSARDEALSAATINRTLASIRTFMRGCAARDYARPTHLSASQNSQRPNACQR